MFVAHTYVVTAAESKNGSCLVACDTLLDFEHIAIEIWTGAVEKYIHIKISAIITNA